MKHSKRAEIQNLASGIVGFLGLIGIIMLVLLVTNGLISFGGFVIGTVIAGVVLEVDSWYIGKHFINGEWV
ncbi:MAG TPA: hypothetical protein VJ888_02145 [Mobilitalea sp.]|nr:hypothetical protein [Mobilitalea sp.]